MTVLYHQISHHLQIPSNQNILNDISIIAVSLTFLLFVLDRVELYRTVSVIRRLPFHFDGATRFLDQG